MNSNSVALESPERLPGETGAYTEREPVVIDADDTWMKPLAGEALAPGAPSRKRARLAFMPAVNWDRFEPGARGRVVGMAIAVAGGLAVSGGAILLQRHHQAHQTVAASGPAEVGVPPSPTVIGHAQAPPVPAPAASKPAMVPPDAAAPPKLDEALADFQSLRVPTGPGEVGVAPRPVSQAAQPTPLAAQASPPTQAPAPVGETRVLASAPPAATADAAKAAVEVKPAPLSQAQQIEVIGLVKELGAQLRDTRTRVSELHDAVAQLSKQVETRTNDFEVRLGLAEAATELSASAKAGATTSSGTTLSVAAIVPAHPPGSRAAAAVPVPPPPPPAPERRTVKDYVVKGASPGLAVLSALNPVTGSPSVIEVAVGDQVPGVGKVKSISQRGATWIVLTEAGPIQP